jgi:CRP-like cAMP-binding protein
MLPAKNPALFVNRLLATLPAKDYQQVLAHCEPVELRLTEVLNEPGEQIRYVYFPTDSFISLVTPPDEYAGLEVGLVGDEGMIGTPLLLGVEVTLLRTFVQGAGSAWCMTPERFRDALRQSSALQTTLNRYLYVLMGQLGQLVACTRFHVVEARLARWLLMTQDRAHSDHFHVTHEFLAFMLGVRRVGVTKAASVLQQHKLIRYSRGDITVLDRAGLEAAACGCYGAAEALYDRILRAPKGYTSPG